MGLSWLIVADRNQPRRTRRTRRNQFRILRALRVLRGILISISLPFPITGNPTGSCASSAGGNSPARRTSQTRNCRWSSSSFAVRIRDSRDRIRSSIRRNSSCLASTCPLSLRSFSGSITNAVFSFSTFIGQPSTIIRHSQSEGPGARLAAGASCSLGPEFRRSMARRRSPRHCSRGQGTGERGQGTGDRGQGTGDRGQGRNCLGCKRAPARFRGLSAGSGRRGLSNRPFSRPIVSAGLSPVPCNLSPNKRGWGGPGGWARSPPAVVRRPRAPPAGPVLPNGLPSRDSRLPTPHSQLTRPRVATSAARGLVDRRRKNTRAEADAELLGRYPPAPRNTPASSGSSRGRP
jgi:hypothetical protein